MYFTTKLIATGLVLGLHESRDSACRYGKVHSAPFGHPKAFVNRKPSHFSSSISMA